MVQIVERLNIAFDLAKVLKAGVVILVATLWAGTSQATVLNINVFQDGSNVSLIVNGSVDTTGASIASFSGSASLFNFVRGGFLAGSGPENTLTYSLQTSGPGFYAGGFRAAGPRVANTVSGVNSFGLVPEFLGGGRIVLPQSYVSGSDIFWDVDFLNTTLAAESFVVGDFTYALTDTATINVSVGAAPTSQLPVPSAAVLMLSGLAGVGLFRFRKVSRSNSAPSA